jgi:hypothetical protein
MMMGSDMKGTTLVFATLLAALVAGPGLAMTEPTGSIDPWRTAAAHKVTVTSGNQISEVTATDLSSAAELTQRATVPADPEGSYKILALRCIDIRCYTCAPFINC